MTVTHGYSPDGDHFIFKNVMPPAPAARSLNIMVLDAAGHSVPREEIRLLSAGKNILSVLQVSTGNGYRPQSVYPLHFGLKAAKVVSVAPAYLAARKRDVQWVDNVNPAKYSGQVLLIQDADRLPKWEKPVCIFVTQGNVEVGSQRVL